MTSSPDLSHVHSPKLTGRDSPGHSNRLTVPFDIDEFISICNVNRLDIYFEAIQRADDAALKNFRKEIIRHKRQPQNRPYLPDHTPQGIYRFSPHDEYLLKAIWWEKTKRSKWRKWFYEKTLPVRKAWLFVWQGMELRDNEYLGYVTLGRKEDDGVSPYIGVRMALNHGLYKAGKYMVHYHWQIITAVIAVATLYVMWLSPD